MGFSLPAGLLRPRCALTAPFHPYRALRRGGIFSVALSVEPLRNPPAVSRHAALWRPDFPLPLSGSDYPSGSLTRLLSHLSRTDVYGANTAYWYIRLSKFLQIAERLPVYSSLNCELAPVEVCRHTLWERRERTTRAAARFRQNSCFAAHVDQVEESYEDMKKLAAIGALGLLASCLFAQGLNTGGQTKDDWEEINFEFNSSILSDGYPSLLRLADLLEPASRLPGESNRPHGLCRLGSLQRQAGPRARRCRESVPGEVRR